MKLILVLLVIAATSECRPQARIWGGENATAGQFPFIAAFNNPDQFCDGTIIDHQWIVTAAHCIPDIGPNSTVSVGSHIEHNGTEYAISSTIVHEEFGDDTHNDIALVKIDGTIEFSTTVQPIEFGDADINETCVAIGWGVTSSTSFPDIVQYVELTTIDLEQCKELAEGHADNFYLGPEQVCTLAEEGKGVCFGDSGGPLVCGAKLSGVVSYTVSACAHGLPDVFTRISSYQTWINKHIQD